MEDDARRPGPSARSARQAPCRRRRRRRPARRPAARSARPSPRRPRTPAGRPGSAGHGRRRVGAGDRHGGDLARRQRRRRQGADLQQRIEQHLVAQPRAAAAPSAAACSRGRVTSTSMALRPGQREVARRQAGAQVGAGLGAQGRAVRGRAGGLDPVDRAAVGAGHQPAQPQRRRRSSSARAAIGVRQEPSRAPRKARSAVMLVMVGRVVDPRQQPEHGRVVGPALDADRTLRHRRQHLLRLQRRRDHVLQARAGSARPWRGTSPAPRRPPACAAGSARCRAAAPRPGPGGPRAAAPARRSEAVPTTAPSGSSATLRGPARDQRVPRVGARQHGADHQPGGQERSACPSSSGRRGRACPASSPASISSVNRPLPPISASVRSWIAVALGAHHHDLDRGVVEAGLGGEQRRLDHARLGQGQGRAAGAEPERQAERHGWFPADRLSIGLLDLERAVRDGDIVLGIETSCDETAVALVRADRRVLSAPLFSQLAEHAPYGGVVPEIAARAHVEKLDLLVAQAMREAGPRLRRSRRRRRHRRAGADRRPDGGPAHRQDASPWSTTCRWSRSTISRRTR